MEVFLSDDEKLFLIKGAEENVRNDGRGCTDFRQIVLERGVLSGTSGSCRVQLGHTTDVLVGIKLELESYDAENEKESKKKSPIQFFVDFSANASSQFAGKGGDSYAEELAAALQVTYANSLDILPNLQKTQLVAGCRWKIYVDATVLQWNGSVIDAISLAVVGALSDLEIPEVDIAPDDGGKVSIVLRRPRKGGNVRDEEVPVAMWKLDMNKCPILVTVSKIGTTNVLDCTPEEETCIRSQLWVGITSASCETEKGAAGDQGDYEVTCVKQVGGGFLETASVNEMVQLAVQAARGLHNSLQQRIKSEEYRSTAGIRIMKAIIMTRQLQDGHTYNIVFSRRSIEHPIIYKFKENCIPIFIPKELISFGSYAKSLQDLYWRLLNRGSLSGTLWLVELFVSIIVII